MEKKKKKKKVKNTKNCIFSQLSTLHTADIEYAN